MRENLRKERRQTNHEADTNENMEVWLKSMHVINLTYDRVQIASVPYPEINQQPPRRFLYDVAHPHDELQTCKRCHRDDMRGRCRHMANELEAAEMRFAT